MTAQPAEQCLKDSRPSVVPEWRQGVWLALPLDDEVVFALCVEAPKERDKFSVRKGKAGLNMPFAERRHLRE
jgi:hypothetical protein